MTEEEALTKWCPYRQLVSQTGWKHTEMDSKKCIASGCMMWMDLIVPVYADPNNPQTQTGLEYLGGHCGLTK